MNYTKGEWIYDERVGCVAVYAAPRENCLALPSKRFIYHAYGKEVYKEDGTFDHWDVDPEQCANARLIAAAPEMYEALKEALGFTNGEIFNMVAAALAKAEGEVK